MVNLPLLNVVLNHWLCNDLVRGNLYRFLSLFSVISGLLNDRIHLHSSIFLSLELNINILSLNDWLNIGLVVNFLSRSGYVLSSSSLLENRLSHDRLSSLILRFGLLEVDSFGVVDDLSLDDRLGVDFLGGGLEATVDSFFRELSRSGLYGGVINLSLSSIDLKLNILCKNSGLNILLSDGSLSWDVNGNLFGFGSAVNDWLFVFSLGIHGSRNDLFSNNRGLNNSLLDDGLLDNSLGDDWLRDDFSGDNWLRNDLLSLSDYGFRVHDLATGDLGSGLVLGGLSFEGGSIALDGVGSSVTSVVHL